MENTIPAIGVCSILNLPNLLSFPSLPENAFGIFVTLTRTQVITSWPHDIHGCVGYWDSNYNPTSQAKLQEKIKTLAYDAAFHDKRKDYFPPLTDDPNTDIKISFMLLPLLPIDPSFDNSDIGLIYDNGSEKATYLPGVFPHMPITKIMTSLKEKAQTSSANNTFLAYKTLEISHTLYNSLFSQAYIMALLNNYVQFISRFESIPYAIIHDNVVYDDTQDVRNLAVLATLLHLNYDHFIPWYNKYISRQHFGVMDGNSSISRQAMSSIYTITKDEAVADYLWNERNELEDVFERPQILISLVQSKYGNEIRDDVIKRMTSFNLSGIEDIFKANWWAQLIIASGLYQYQDIFVRYFLSIYPTILGYETNYLAVFFEGVSCLKDSRLEVSLFNVFIELLHRYDIDRGLFRFKDGSIRVDITNHVINGLLQHF